jgi:hypothetical protein
LRTTTDFHTDIAITAVVKMKPFSEKAKLDSSDNFFDVRDKVAKVLNRRPQDLTLGYYCSWWTVKAQASPNALRDEESWVELVDEIKLWLAGDKKRVGTAWHIAVMDKDDAEGSGKATTKAANEKKVCVNSSPTCEIAISIDQLTHLLRNRSLRKPSHHLPIRKGRYILNSKEIEPVRLMEEPAGWFHLSIPPTPVLIFRWVKASFSYGQMQL